MYTFATTPQSMGRVLDDGTALYRTSFRQIFPMALISAALLNLPNFMMPYFASKSAAADTGVPGMPPISGDYFIVMALSYALWHIVAAMLMIKMVRTVPDNTYAATGNLYRKALHRGLLLIVPTILYMVIIMIGFVLFFVPGIIVMLSMMLYAPLTVLDNRNPFRAVSVSHSMICWGNWWRACVIVSVPMIIASVLSMLALAVFGISGGFMEMINGTTQPMAFHVINAVVAAITTPLYLAVLIVLMHDLKLRRDGADLEARLIG